jgi:hypothetical protein
MRHMRWSTTVTSWLSLGWAATACAQSSARIDPPSCTHAAARPVALVELPGSPFQAIPTADGCFVFVSLVGPVEPGDPRRPPKPGAPRGGIAVIGRADGEPSLIRVVPVEGSPWGMTLTHDGQLLIVTSDDRVAFIDPAPRPTRHHAAGARDPRGSGCRAQQSGDRGTALRQREHCEDARRQALRQALGAATDTGGAARQGGGTHPLKW